MKKYIMVNSAGTLFCMVVKWLRTQCLSRPEQGKAALYALNGCHQGRDLPGCN
jgi:hypothetical protein